MAPRPDPWAEQARREAARRQGVRRRRRRWQVPLIALVVAGVVAGSVFFVVGWVHQDDAAAPDAVTASTAPAEPAATVPPEQLVSVREVWLVDRGDGLFDWGVTVVTPEFAPRRSGVDVDVRLIDVGGDVVFSRSATLDGVNSSVPTAVGGQLTDTIRQPVRLEFDVSVGHVSLDPALGDWLAVRALEFADGELSGRVSSGAPLTDVTALFVWRDDAGEVEATMPLPVSAVRPGVDARFDVDVSEQGLPDRRPDDVVWSG